MENHKKDDEIITVNNTPYSMRKILGEDAWQKYLTMSDKAKQAARLIIRIDLSRMEIGFAKLDKMFDKHTRQDKPISQP